MTQINSFLRPELDSLLNDINKYPELYNRYKMLKNNEYIDNIFMNVLNRNYNEKIKWKNKEEGKIDSNIINKRINNENINKIFFKRSNSMEFIAQNSSSGNNIFEY